MALNSSMLRDLPQSGRVLRRPVHPFHVRTRPWQLQPIMIAPVLPGESMRNLLMQARVVTDPIKNPLIGWHAEYYYFYVKHRDLDDRATMEAMVLDANANVSSLRSAADVKYHHFDNGINYTRLATKRVVEEYFRDEGEAWDTWTIDGVPLVSVNNESWLHSTILASQLTADDIDLTGAGSQAGTSVMASEIDAAMRQWEFLRANNLTTMDYEQFLATYGVRPRKEELHIPELLRYVKQWQYPSNTVNPATGVPSSAVSWAIAERADKDRFFREPGFIIGYQCVRPKVYRQNQDGSCTHLLDRAFDWLPAILQDDPATSLKLVVGTEGPLDTLLAVDYVVDVRDLFIYGDEFVNFAKSDTNANIISLPTAVLGTKRYAASADADELFAAASPANQIRSDGVVSLTIAGTQTDTTPSSGMRIM